MASPFGRHLSTNYCPTDAEVLQIKNLLAEPRRQLLSLEGEIAQLQQAIQNLEQKRRDLSKYVDEHSALISPMRRLPQDILGEIFLACLPTHRNCAMSASEAPVLLGRICSAWRAISLATPRLWARLHIVEPGEYDKNIVPQRLEIVKMWLRRSRSCPLSVSLYCKHPYVPPPPQPYNVFLKELVLHAKRWEFVSVTTSRGAFQAMEHLKATDVPMLKGVAASLHGEQRPDVPRWTQFGILRAPFISSFSTSARDFNLLLPPPLHWHLLTELTVSGPGLETPLDSASALETLSRCPRLQTCCLTIRPSSSLLPLPVTLPSLHSLELHLNDMPSPFLDRLQAPELRKFVLRGRDEALPVFLRSCSILETFELDHSDFQKSSLSDAFRALPPTLRHLTLWECKSSEMSLSSRARPIPLDDYAFAALVPILESSTEYSCPALESLTITSPHDVSDWALREFIVRRCSTAAAPSLKRVWVVSQRPMEVDLKTECKLFMDAGLEMDLVYPPPR
ncbi:hypothetical protein R3P38DRAFT_3049152 [Favolaschia claudopus]|uniref:F-box domain-containing protein n=1 Tax=Favolaschia claudopus TaxID=2862362 RepID=A0AAW0A5V1_9AGAR